LRIRPGSERADLLDEEFCAMRLTALVDDTALPLFAPLKVFQHWDTIDHYGDR
jgi:hypothetical protein